MQSKSRPLIKTLLFCGGLLLAGSAGAATDAKWYPASRCSTLGLIPGSLIHFAGTVQNVGVSGLQVNCPLPAEIGTIKSAKIKVHDRHPSEAVQCWLYNESYSGADIFQSSEFQQSSGFGSEVRVLTYGAQAPWTGQLYARCYLPPTSGGISSHVSEFYINEGT